MALGMLQRRRPRTRDGGAVLRKALRPEAFEASLSLRRLHMQVLFDEDTCFCRQRDICVGTHIPHALMNFVVCTFGVQVHTAGWVMVKKVISLCREELNHLQVCFV